MNSFLEFFKRKNNNPSDQGNRSEILRLEVKRTTSTALVKYSESKGNLKQKDVAVFSEKFGSLVVSDKFISELSDIIQRPHFGEKKETFVRRCKESLSALIDKHFDEQQ